MLLLNSSGEDRISRALFLSPSHSTVSKGIKWSRQVRILSEHYWEVILLIIFSLVIIDLSDPSWNIRDKTVINLASYNWCKILTRFKRLFRLICRWCFSKLLFVFLVLSSLMNSFRKLCSSSLSWEICSICTFQVRFSSITPRDFVN